MKKCLLCEKKMNSSNNFGKGCLKNIYNIMGIYNPKNTKTEQILNEEILKLCKKKELPEKQNQLLVDRYLTLNILNHVSIPAYDKYRTSLQNDIDLINNKTKKEELRSFDMITLKQANHLHKIYEKYKDVFQKINNGEYDFLQNISFDIIRLAFSKYYSKKDYLYDGVQLLQYGILQSGVAYLLSQKCDFSAMLLEHSLKNNPEDLIITEYKYIDKIKRNKDFNLKINNIIENYGNKDEFDTGIQGLTFDNNEEDETSFDLMGSIHDCSIQVIGKKKLNSSWDLEIIITDKYDFTELQKIKKYIAGGLKNFALATGNNLAMFATSCKVVHEYNIIIKFTLQDWK